MMWKKQWSKLKTALGTPEEYVEEEKVEEVEVEEVPEYCSDPVIEIKNEDIAPIIEVMANIKNLKVMIGEMALRHEEERYRSVDLNKKLNAQLNEQIITLRTIYNVEPTVDYALNFPSEGGGPGNFTRQSDED
jgi:hypothetical protein